MLSALRWTIVTVQVFSSTSLDTCYQVDCSTQGHNYASFILQPQSAIFCTMFANIMKTHLLSLLT
jgi:hypothetical protein